MITLGPSGLSLLLKILTLITFAKYLLSCKVRDCKDYMTRTFLDKPLFHLPHSRRKYYNYYLILHMGRLSLWEVKWHVRPWPSSLHCPAQCTSVLTLEQRYLHSTKRKEIGKSILNLFAKCVKTSCPNEAALCSGLMWASRNPSKKWTLTLSKSHVRIWVEKITFFL